MGDHEAPPRVAWAPFINAQVEMNRALKPGHGRHRLYEGQTQGGKTTLNRIMLRMKRFSLVFGTKPKDSSLDDYIAKEGFVRIEHWPPTKEELKQRGRFGQVKLLLWPRISEYADLKRHVPIFRQAARDIAVEGGWTLSIDEGLWACSKKGLDLGDEISAIAFGGASNGLSLHLVIQRPSGIPVITYASCHDAYLFKSGNTNDIRELASYGSHDTMDVARAIRSLNRGDPRGGHQFLYMPMSGGSQWAVSEVPASWV